MQTTGRTRTTTHHLSGPERYRRWLAIMGLTARDVETPAIVRILALARTSGGEKQVQRAREQIGLRLNPNPTFLDTTRILPGQDVLVREIRRHTADMYVWDETEAADRPGLDYEELWYSLCDTADLLHGAGEAGTPARSWPEPKTSCQLAATLPGVAA